MTSRAPVGEREGREEAAQWATAYEEDCRLNTAVGQVHLIKEACFKYVVQHGVGEAKRFFFMPTTS